MIPIIQLGMGPLGQKMTSFIRQKKMVKTVAAVDPDPAKIGWDIGRLGGGDEYNIKVSSSLSEALASAGEPPRVALMTTVSDMNRITPQIEACIDHGLSVVSTCEELFFPWDQSPEWSQLLHEKAKQAGVSVVGTGVNPGFLMDTLPAQLTAVCQEVHFVEVQRIQDASSRRLPFQQKIGAGLSLEAFAAKKQAGTLRHVGLTESMQFIAHALGWKLDRTEDIIEPVIREETGRLGVRNIPKGQVAGVLQTGLGYVNGALKIRLVFRAAIGEPESFEEVRITGVPNIISRIDGGIHGDIATCAIAINACKSILEASPGLHTMASLPMVSAVL